MMRLGVALVVLLGVIGSAMAGDSGAPRFEAAEIGRILQHGPWPPPVVRDPSNRVSGQRAAISLGERLFFERRLSVDATMDCATCHQPAKGWSDEHPRGAGRQPLDRNTTSVWNVAFQRWFGWDGANDSLWAQSLRPILDAREMAATPAHVASVVRSDPTLACRYERAFGRTPAAAPDDETLLVDVGKALAAYMETLVTRRTAFDDFRDALARGDTEAAARYPASARRGAVLFVKSDCAVCHVGPAFTNGEFHDVGVPYALPGGGVDAGRARGIAQVRADRFNLLGPWSDDASRASAVKTRHVEAGHATFGQFRTPSLRNLALTAPYMHDGRYATLREAVRHYSELDMERIHTHGEQLLRPLKLADAEVDDLVAFLESLTDRGAVAVPAAPVAGRGCGA